MSDLVTRSIDLVQTARGLPHGPARVALYEEALRLADASGEDRLGYLVRAELIDACTFAEREDLLPVLLAWNLAHFDRHEGELSPNAILSLYFRVMWWLPLFVEIPRAQVLDLFADLERRVRRHGESPWRYHRYFRKGMQSLKDTAAARPSHEYLQANAPPPDERDEFSETSGDCRYLIDCERHAEAVARAEPLLASRRTGVVEPQQLVAALLYSYLRVGRRAEADGLLTWAVRLIRKDGKQYPGAWCDIVRYLVLTGQFAPAKRALEEKLPLMFAPTSRVSRCDWARAGLLFAEGLRRSGESFVKMRLPAGAPPADGRGRVGVAELAGWFRAEAEALGARYDARNGNDWWARHIAAVGAELAG